ncbi:MAG TPA: serine/threonine-protein kinase [Gaiellaceae bacterium]|nr:serine/threonine-protein kinase [Gaiellaceae bacterium]
MDTATAGTTRYELERELGRGGMAVVHAARDRELGRPVALKVLAAHLAGDDAFRRRFLREARIAASLQHPGIVRVYGVTELGGLPCLVLELVEGGTLEAGRLTLEQAAGVADALAYAHRRGVVHRDLKPANLLRGRHGEVKLADFGIAHAAEETRLTQAGTVLGTLRYLAPEQAEGRETGPASDVYSLAVVLDELLAERPSELEHLLARCRSREPRRRPAAAELAAALRGETLPATAVTVVARPPRRRAPLVVLPAAAVAAAAAAALAAVLLAGSSSGRTPPPRVAPVARAHDAAAQARALVAWLERYSAAP